MPEPNVTVIRPELTAEERAERQKKVEKCVSDFWKALKKEESQWLARKMKKS